MSDRWPRHAPSKVGCPVLVPLSFPRLGGALLLVFSFGRAHAAGQPVLEGAVQPLLSPVSSPADPRLAWSLPLQGGVQAIDWLGEEVALRLSRSLVLLDPEAPSAARRVPLPGVPAGPVVGSGALLALPVVGGDLVVISGGLARLWHTPAGFSHVTAVQGGLVLGRDGASHLVAFDPRLGVPRWKTRIAFDDRAPAAVPGLLVGVRGKDLRAVRAEDGAFAWQARLARPAVQVKGAYDGGGVFALDAEGELTALSALDGAPRWTRRLPGLGPLAATATLRDDADALVIVAGGRVIRIAHEGGALLYDGTLGKRETTVDPDTFEGQLCTAPFGGGLSCGRLGEPPRFTVPLGAITASPLLLGDTALVATADKRLHRVRVDVAEETGEGGTIARTALVTIGGAAAPVPVVEVRGEGPCAGAAHTLDLDGYVAPALPAELELEEYRRTWGAAEEGWRFDPAWQVEPLSRRWEVSYWYAWDPEVIDASVYDGSEQDALDLGALLHCELDSGDWLGELRARQGNVTRLYQGRLHVQSLPHEVEGELGCLLEVSLDDEPIGVWAGPGEDAWLDLHIALEGASAAPVLGLDASPPVGLLEGELHVETLLPGAEGRAERVFQGELELDYHRDWLSVDVDGNTVFDLFAPDLRYAQRVEGRLDGQAAPEPIAEVENEGVWRLKATTAERFLPLWTLPACAEPDEASAPPAAAPAPQGSPAPAADPAPTEPPLRRRSGLRGKPTDGPLPPAPTVPPAPILPPLDPPGGGPLPTSGP